MTDVVEISGDGSFDASLMGADVEAFKAMDDKAYAEKNLEAAVELYSKALAGGEPNHVLYSNRSAAHLHLEQHQLALADAVKAIELSPEWAKVSSCHMQHLIKRDTIAKQVPLRLWSDSMRLPKRMRKHID